MGYIKVDREIRNCWIWVSEGEPFSKGQAWIDLILLANWKDKKAMYKGEVIVCKRGDVNLSITALSERWNWGRKKTKAFLNALESDEMVVVEGTTHRTTITLVNYDKYQALGTTDGTTEEQQRNNKGTTKEQQRNTTNKYKEYKEYKEKEYKEKEKHKYGTYGHVRLTDAEHQKLIEKYGDNTEKLIQFLDEAIEEKGYKYKSHYLTIYKDGSWVAERVLGKNKPAKANNGFHNFQERNEPVDVDIMKNFEQLAGGM